jgi:HEAT repeat protein
MHAGAAAMLSTFWKRRMTMLFRVSRSQPRLSRRAAMLLVAASVAVFALPTLKVIPVAAESVAAAAPPEKGPKSKPLKEPEYKGRTVSQWGELLDSRNIMDRQEAVLALHEFGTPAVPYLAKALSDKELTNCQIWAAWGLRKLGPAAKAAVPQLEAALKDKLALVRIDAARTLWAVAEHKDAIPTLIEHLKDKEPSYRADAARALAAIGPKAKAALPALRAAVSDPSSWESVRPEGPMGPLRKISYSVSAIVAAAIKRIESDGPPKPLDDMVGATWGEIVKGGPGGGIGR